MPSKTYSPRLKTAYNAEIRKQLLKDLGLKNVEQVPKVEKIIVASGLGRGKDDKRLFEAATRSISKISGQRPIDTFARISIASFKLREGNKVGQKVTLRGDRMYEFLDRLVTTVLPRVRDFHGVSERSFDGQGNFSLGFKDQSVFPELSFEDTTISHGLQVTIVTTADNKSAAKELLSAFGMPFEKKESN